MPRLRHTNGGVVEVPKEKVEGLLSRGFTSEEDKKTTTRKSSSAKSSK